MRIKPTTAIPVLLLVVASLLVAGCTTSTQNTSNTSGGHMSVAAVQVIAPTKIDGHSPNQGDKFVTYNTTVTNVDARDRMVTYGSIKVKDSNGYSYGALSWQNTATTFPIIMTQPGDKVNGLIVFEVPQNAKITTMVYDDHLYAGNNYPGNVTISLAGSSNSASSATSSTSTTPGAQSTSTPSGSPSSNPSVISQPTSSPTSSPTAIPTPTTTPAPTTTTKSVTIYAERGCPYCEAAIADYTSQGYVVTVLYPGDPGFVPQASYPVIVDTSTGGY